MNILKFFGIGLMSLTLCAGFASCSDDDEPADKGNGNGNNEKPSGVLKEFSKRLTLLEEEGSKSHIKYHFSFDASSGWVSEYLKEGRSMDSDNDKWSVWENKKLEYTANELKVVGSSDKYVLDANGKVEKFVSENGNKVCTYTYLPNGLLSKSETTNSKNEGVREVSFKWDGTKLMQITQTDHAKNWSSTTYVTSVVDFKYDGQKAIGAYPIILSNDYIQSSCPNQVGIYLDEIPVSYTTKIIRTKVWDDKVDGKQQREEDTVFVNHTFTDVEIAKDKYLKKINYKQDEKSISRKYNFDKNGDGKISKDEEVGEEKTETYQYSFVYTFTWEPKK